MHTSRLSRSLNRFAIGWAFFPMPGCCKSLSCYYFFVITTKYYLFEPRLAGSSHSAVSVSAQISLFLMQKSDPPASGRLRDGAGRQIAHESKHWPRRSPAQCFVFNIARQRVYRHSRQLHDALQPLTNQKVRECSHNRQGPARLTSPVKNPTGRAV